MRFARFAGLLILLVAAVACGASSNLPLCALPAVQPAFNLVQPSPGATGVADNLSDLAFEGTAPTGNQVTLAGGTQSMTLTLEPVPQPSGQPPLGFNWSASIPTTLLASTAYSITYPLTTSGSNCQAKTYAVPVGTFTTQ